MTGLTVTRRTDPQNAGLGERCDTVPVMSMTQLVIGTAIGFMVARGALYLIERLIAWLQREEWPARIRALLPSPGPALVGAFIRYAAPFGASAALITLGVWAVSDYLAARSARNAPLATVLDPSSSDPAREAQGAADEPGARAAPANVAPVAALPAAGPDPYTDSEFTVRHRPQRAGTPLSLKEALVQRAEARARTDLLKEIRQHVKRSQYDCEAAERANKYLKAGLDVWGFATWQLKHFPLDSYKGATLAQRKDIKNVVDPTRLNLQSALARESSS